MAKRKPKDDGQLSLFTECGEPKENIIKQEYSEIMSQSYIDYAMSVIISRAVPDIRDGLKPVQRRILYDMGAELHVDYDKPYKKSARIVGDTMGKFHPHGDSSIYDAMVVMAQDFKKQVPLIDGHGNFGSIEGDGAAAQRYTEARLAKVAQDAFLTDLNLGTVDFVPNYDGTESEPETLPAKIPNFLINGSEGIAVGMTTSTPPHNLTEVLEAEKALLKNPGLSTEELMGYVEGPDFPTGGVVANKDALTDIYKTGAGKIRIQGKLVHEKDRQGNRLVVTEIPYTMVGSGIAAFLNDVAALADTKQAPDITDISNQSSSEGIRIVIELRKNADDAAVENTKAILFQKTKLEDTFGVNMLAIAGGKPEVVSLKSALQHHIDFMYEANTRKYTELLKKEREKAEIQEGLMKAVDAIDAVVEAIRGSKSRKQAKACLMGESLEGVEFRTKKNEAIAKKFAFTDAQADAILDMRLARLIGLEMDLLQKDHEKSLKMIEKYEKLLSKKDAMRQAIEKDIDAIIKEYGRPRRTEIKNVEKMEVKKEEQAAFEEAILIDRFGYARAVGLGTYEKNKEAADAEFKHVARAMSDGKLYVFSESGMCFTIATAKIPVGKIKDKGVPLDNISAMDTTKDGILYVCGEPALAGKEFMMATSSGKIKRMAASEIPAKSKATSVIKMENGERLLAVAPLEKGMDAVFVSDAGKALRFHAENVPAKKKAAGGVAGISLKNGEKAVDAVFVKVEGKGNGDGKVDIEADREAGKENGAEPPQNSIELKNTGTINVSGIPLGRRGGAGTKMA